MLMRGFDWCFRSRADGRITIGQWPNLSLWLFMAASGVGWIAGRESGTGRVADVAADSCLAWWAADEVLRGVNPWRRCLGAGVLAWLVRSWIAG